jgi:hypothetical protein
MAIAVEVEKTLAAKSVALHAGSKARSLGHGLPRWRGRPWQSQNWRFSARIQPVNAHLPIRIPEPRSDESA